MNRTTKLLGYLFSLISIGVFVLSLFSDKDDPLKNQTLYWFIVAGICLILPGMKKLKYKDVEIELRENIERVEKKVDKLSDTFFNSLDDVWREENDMPNFLKEKRLEHWDEFQVYVDSLSVNERLEVQIKNTFHYLKQYGISVNQLKEKLKTLGYYWGEMNDDLSKDVINSIVEFQKANSLRHIDGIFGPSTYQKMNEQIKRLKEKST